MDKENINKFVGNDLMTIVDAMEMIGINSKGILFIINEEQSLTGCVTDGDIRRWILKSGDLNATIDKAMMNRPQFLTVEQREQAEKVMLEKAITALPIVDEKRRIQDIVFLYWFK